MAKAELRSVAALLAAVLAFGLCSATPVRADDSIPKANAIEVFAGKATWTSFTNSIF